MKKAGIFAAVIAVVLIFAQFYNYKLLGYTQDAMYVIDEAQAAKNLKNQEPGEESLDLKLKKYEESSPIYKRGKAFFVGKEYDALQLSYPVYVNEGNFLYSLSDEMDLIASDFTALNTYDGLYVAYGHSYNRDREQADPDEFIFMKSPDGLFLNVQEMTIRSGAGEQKIPVNSLMNLEKEGVFWYEFQEGSYLYRQYRDVIQAEVTVGSVTMPYSQLIDRLIGMDEEKLEKQDNEKEEQKESEEAQEETVQETVPEESLSMEDGQSVPGEAAEESLKEGEYSEESLSDESLSSAGAASEDSLPVHPPIPGDSQNWKFPNLPEDGGSEDGDGEHEEDGAEKPDLPEDGGPEDGNGDDGSGDDGEGDLPGGDDGGEFPFEKPSAAVRDFVFSVYDAKAQLSVQDPSHSMIKGVRLVFYKEGEARASYRKMFYTSGELAITPLEPDTRYEVEGYFDYRHPQQGKQREIFLERTPCGKTLPVSGLDPMEIVQEADTVNVEPHAITVKDMQILLESQKRASSSDAESGLSAVSYIAAVQMDFEKRGMPDWNAPSTSMGSVQMNQLKRGDRIQWKIPDILDSDSRYDYKITFYDRYGNQLPVEDPSMARGQARTCKELPKAVLSVDHKSTIDKTALHVEMENPDQAKYSETPYLYVTYADMPETPVPFKLEGEKEEQIRYELKNRDEADLVFTSLLPNTVYIVWVKGSFDVEDGKNHEKEVMGELPVTTGSLTGLGTVNFHLEADRIASSSAEVDARIRSEIPKSLYPFISRLDFSMHTANEEEAVFSTAFEREKLEKETIQPGGEFVLATPSSAAESPSYDPAVTVSLSADSGEEKSVWDALLTNGTLKVRFGEDGLASATEFQARMRAKAVRGSSDGSSVEEDVTGRYYQTSFKTLKQPAKVKYGMSYVNGSSASFYQLRVDDPDGAVLGGKLTLRLRNASNAALLEVRTMTTEELNAMDVITFQNLEENKNYRLEIVAAEYNEGYTNSSKMLQKLIGELSFRSENSLYGTMKLDSMSNGYETEDPKDGYSIESINLFDINQGELDYAINTNGIFHSAGNLTSDYIEVEEDAAYMLGGGTAAKIFQYDSEKNPISVLDTPGVSGEPGTYYRTRPGVRYIRVYCGVSNSATAYVSRLLFAEQDSVSNLMKKADITEGIIVSGDTEQKFEQGASTGYIAVEPGSRMLRLDASVEGAEDRRYRLIHFYDADKKYIAYTDPNAVCGTVAVPDNARYVRVNMNRDCQDRIYLGKRAGSLFGKNLLDASGNPDIQWVQGMTLSYQNRYVKNSYNYWQYCEYVPVKASAVYYLSGISGTLVYDEDRTFLGYVSGTNYLKMPDNAAYIRANVNFTENYTIKPILRQITPLLNLDSLNIGIQITLDDPEKNLGDAPFFTLEIDKTDIEGETESWTEEYEIDPESRKFNEVVYLEKAEPDCQYEIRQTVDLGGNQVILSSISLNTASTARVIKSEAGLRAVRYNPIGDFAVVRDIEVKTASNVIDSFYGTIDFQGHQVTMTNRRTLFNSIMEQGRVENLVADIQVTEETGAISSSGLIANINRGVMENIVLKTSVNNGKDNTSWGGICQTNYGTLDNFAIQMTGDVYTRANSGLAAYSNYGQISNGYLVSDGQSRITMDMNVSGQGVHYQKAGLVAVHSGGSLRNLYAVAEIDDPASKDFGNQGLVAAMANGDLENVFSVGMTLQNGVPSDKTGPAVGSVGSENNVKNISYVETKSFSEKHYKNSYNNRVSNMSLWDQEWMDTAVNEDGRFLTAMVLDGLYPQLQMPPCMDGKQPVVSLPSRQSASIKLISNEVREQAEDYALVRFFFDNRNRLEVKAVEMAVMNMESGVRTYLAPAAQTEIVGQGTDEAGLYYADVRIHQPEHFRSKYYVNKFTAGIAGNDSTNFDVEEGSQDKMEVGIEFYQDIRTVADWRDKVCSSQADVYGNYRLKADTFDFGNLKPSDFKTQYRLSRAFYGTIDGQWKDENGELHTAVLKNINMDMPYMIYDLYGTVKNLRVENLRMNVSETSTDGYIGFIRRLMGGTADHIEIVSSEIHASSRGGLLTSESRNGSVIQNTSAKDSRIVTFEPKSNSKAYAGGLVGYASQTELRNCYVQGLELDNMKALDNAGVGGLIGYAETVTVKNCYAEGMIRTGYRNAGGLMGYQSSAASVIENCYAKVNIDAYGSFVGGLIGAFSGQNNYSGFQGNLSLGNLFVHSTSAEGVHRIAGYPAGGKYGQNFGFESQMFNNKVDAGDADDAEAVLAAADLSLRDTYFKRLGWKESDYALSWDNEGTSQGVAEGYLPKLRGTEGQLLPGQDPIPFGTGEMKLEVDGFTINAQAGEECYQWFGHKNITQAYKLIFGLSYDKAKYRVAEVNGAPDIYIEGMKMNTRVNASDGEMKDGYKAGWLAGQNRQRWEFPFVQSELGGNIYCLSVVMESVENPDVRVTLSAAVSPTGGAAVRIGNAKEWNEAMKKYKDTYGNFELTGDIDLSSIPKEELVTGIKLNSLTSAGGPFTISGIDHEVNGIRESFISNCLSGISNVRFEKCSWIVPENKRNTSYENIGLIGMNQGAIRNVTFEDIVVESGKGSYTGCIGYNMGMVEDVTVRNVRVSGDTAVGGLAGGTMQPMRRITAEGTLSRENDGWTSDYLVRGRENVGGVVGNGNLAENVRVTGVKVLGTNETAGSGNNVANIGGAIGNGSFIVPGQSTGENKEKESLVADTFVTAENAYPDKPITIKNLGGVAGSGSQNYIVAENVQIRCKEASYVGGIAGTGYISYGTVRTAGADEAVSYQIPRTVVECLEFAGGVIGNGGMGNGVVEGIEVTALKSNAGGVAGINGSGIGTCLADRISVRAPQAAGGISGEGRADIGSNLVARSQIQSDGPYAGGVCGLTSNVVTGQYGNGVIHTDIQAGGNQETGESFAGGVTGSYAYAGNTYGNYTRETSVRGDGDNVGGLFGYAAGGQFRQNFSDSSSTVEGRNNVGGFIGLMQGRQTAVPGSYEETLFYESYNKNAVRGQDYVGGFIGRYTPGPGDYWLPNPKNFYGLVMMGTVEANGASYRTATASDAPAGASEKASVKADLFVNTDGGGWSGKSLRLFTEAQLNGQRAADLYSDMEYLETYKTKSLGNSLVEDEKADTEKLTSTLLVTSKDLMDTRIYNKSFEVGGMGWAGSWNYQGLGRMDTETEQNMTYKPGVGVRIRKPDGTVEEIPADTPLFDATDLAAKDGTVPVIVMPEGAVSCIWYRAYQANASQSVHIKSGAEEFPLAGRGYYFGVAKMADGSSKYTSLVKMDTDPYMPYANVGSVWSRGAQEGLPKGFGTGLDASEQLWGWKEATENTTAAYTYTGYAGNDNEFYGGVIIPESQSGPKTLSLNETVLSDVTVYPSGADTINVELGADLEGVTRLLVEAGGQILCDTVPTERVYTVNYDYRSPVTVTLAVGVEAQTITVDASNLRRTVMVWGDEYYYTCGGTLMGSSGEVLDEEIIHLYRGEALSMDGTVYDLKGGDSRKRAEEPWSEEQKAKAFWENEELRAFGTFTEVNADGETVTREQQLVEKDGRLYALTEGQSLKGMVLDSYNGETYASFLDEEGTLRDAADKIQTPEHFNRKGIAHMSSSLDGDAPYALVRYANGAAKGFNYVTGEELPIENAFSDVSFLDFAAGFADQFFGADGGSLEFADLKELEHQLTLSPITKSELSEAVNRLEQTEEGKDGAAAGPDSVNGADGQGEAFSEDGSNQEAGQPGEAASEQEAFEQENLEQEASEKDSKEETSDSEDSQTKTDESGQPDEKLQESDRVQPENGRNGEIFPEKHKDDEGQLEKDKEPGSQPEQSGKNETGKGQPGRPDTGKAGSDRERDGDSKTAEAEKNTSKPESGNSETPSENGQKQKEDISGRAASYTYAFNTKDGSSRLYSTEDLLSSQAGEVMNEEEKLELMKAAGLVTEDRFVISSASEEQSKRGIAAFAAAAAAAVGLAWFLIRRKRRYEE